MSINSTDIDMDRPHIFSSRAKSSSSLQESLLPPRPKIHINSQAAISTSFVPTPNSPLVDAHAVHDAERSSTLGTKQIGPVLSFVFMVNQIYGPGVLAIPIVFQQSGWFPTIVTLFLFMILSCTASTLLADAIASIPGNKHFQQRVEFGNAVKYFYGRRAHFIFQIFLNITLQSYNIASIVICAQSLDQALIAVGGKTWAFEINPDFGFHAYEHIDSLYASDNMTITLGYIIILVLFLPQGFLNLSENVKTIQVASFVFLFVLLIEFMAYYIWEGDHNDQWAHIPAIGEHYTQLVSVFIFSWAFVIFVPSWLNEKEKSVSVNRIIWSSGIVSFIGYITVGLLAAFVYEKLKEDNVLNIMSKSPTPLLTQICAYLFSLGVIAPGIPVCSVTTRYNLYVSRTCGKKQSYFWGVIAPWLVGFIFCQGEFFATFLNWTSLIFNGIVNLVVPFLLYIRARTLITTPHVVELNDEIILSDDDEADTMMAQQLFATDSPVASQWHNDRRASGSEPSSPTEVTSTSTSVQDENVTVVEMGLSEVHPFSPKLQPYGRSIAIFLCVITILLIAAQAAIDLYYLIALHKNVLD